jgi:hypothetical protein
MPPVLVTVLFQIGIPGVALVLTFGQLVSQIFVEEFTLQFLNLYGNEFVVRIALVSRQLLGTHNMFTANQYIRTHAPIQLRSPREYILAEALLPDCSTDSLGR